MTKTKKQYEFYYVLVKLDDSGKGIAARRIRSDYAVKGWKKGNIVEAWDFGDHDFAHFRVELVEKRRSGHGICGR